MFSMSVPWWEFVVRGVAVYLFLLVFLRLTGRRQTGQYAPFDLVLLLILSNAVRSEEHTSELQSPCNLVCRLLLEKKKRHHKHSPGIATACVPFCGCRRPMCTSRCV